MAPCLLLVVPLVIFLRHQQYSLTALESLLCIGGFTLVGVTLASLSAVFGAYVGLPLSALLVAFMVDVQSEFVSDLSSFALVAGVALVVAIVLRAHMSAMICVVCGTILVTSIALPVSDPSGLAFYRPEELPSDPKRPPIVHVILDGMIGIQGVPGDLDPDGSTAADLTDFFVERGFTVYGKAHSTSWFTRPSLGAAMNFTADVLAAPTFELTRSYLGANAYFTEMVRRGYRIHVYQTDFFEFCRDEDGLLLDGVQSCQTFPATTLAALNVPPMSIPQKASLIAALFSELSSAVVSVRSRYQVFRRDRGGLPRWDTPVRLSPVSAMGVFDRLEADLPRVEPGNLYLAHLLLPHPPFAFDAECRCRSNPASWGSIAHGTGDVMETRARRNEFYFAQVTCTLKRLAAVFDAMNAHGRFVGAQIIVHGDHGSRITFPMGRTGANHVAARSTLFAFREAGDRMAGVYDDVLAPINVLLPEVLKVDGRGLAAREFTPMRDFGAGQFIGKAAGRTSRGPAATP